MRYYYEYKEKNGATVGGHNLEIIKNIQNVVIELAGFDFIQSYKGEYKRPWVILLDSEKLEYLKITPMEDEEKKDE